MKALPQPVALFVSDIHLGPDLPETTQAFLNFLRDVAQHVPTLCILGDLFEYWAGDDDRYTDYYQSIIQALHTVSDSGTHIFWMAGNRDFLIGEGFLCTVDAQALPDPYVLEYENQRILLSHGDLYCTDDIDYMRFREQVRNPDWQAQFLAQPPEQRKATIEHMRTTSRLEQRGKTYEIMDVNQAAIAIALEENHASLMIHGHTHRPNTHTHITSYGTAKRHVLPDWSCETPENRGGWLTLFSDGIIQRFGIKS